MPHNSEGIDHPSQENGLGCWMSAFLHNLGILSVLSTDHNCRCRCSKLQVVMPTLPAWIMNICQLFSRIVFLDTYLSLQKNASAIRYWLYCGKREVRCSLPAFKLLLSRIKNKEKGKLEKCILLSLATQKNAFLHIKPYYLQNRHTAPVCRSKNLFLVLLIV